MKRPFRAGFVGGGILGVAVALSMDLMLGKSVGGGWSEAVATDMNRIFDTVYSPTHPLVILGAVLVVLLIGAIGGFMGGFFAAGIARLFNTLQRGAGVKQ